MKFKQIILTFSLISFLSVGSQTKNEKELRVDISNFPEHAQIVISSLPNKTKRIKHYKETDGLKESFESKFKYKQHWYSVEFNNSGHLEDIEVTIKQKEIPDSTLEIIHMYLQKNSDKYDIVKIQEQYVYKTKIYEIDFLSSVLRKREDILSNYEIIIALKKDKSWDLREITFNPQGDFLSTRNIQQDSYEYIMY